MKASSVVIASKMKNMGYQSGMGLGKFNQGIKKLPEVYSQDAKCKYGLGYKEEMGEMPKNKHTLNGKFFKLEEDFPYCGFLEPKGGKPGFEIFFKTQLTLEDKAPVEDKAHVEDKADEDWVEQMDPEAMNMFLQEGDVFHIQEEFKEDPAAMIVPSDGITSVWLFENNFLDLVFNNFKSISPVSNYPVNEMNLNFDYMHVSSSNEALNTESILNDEHLINEEDEAKIKPIENETIKINVVI
jgi:hypothetical protein